MGAVRIGDRGLARERGADEVIAGDEGDRPEERVYMNRIILGDNQAIFRAGAARLLAMEDDMRIIAQCDDAARLVAAVEATRGATILLSTGIRADLPTLLEQAKALGSRVILITERAEELSEELTEQLDGVISRSISGPELSE